LEEQLAKIDPTSLQNFLEQLFAENVLDEPISKLFQQRTPSLQKKG